MGRERIATCVRVSSHLTGMNESTVLVLLTNFWCRVFALLGWSFRRNLSIAIVVQQLDERRILDLLPLLHQLLEHHLCGDIWQRRELNYEEIRKLETVDVKISVHGRPNVYGKSLYSVLEVIRSQM